MSPKQKKIAAKAPPRNKIDGKDFAVLKAEKAKGRGKGLQDEKMKPGKIMKADKGGMGEATKYKKYLKGLERVTSKTRYDKAVAKRKAMEAGRRITEGAVKAAKATKIGKIALGVAAVGLGAKEFLKKKIRDNEKKAKANKKMGGGMMMRPIKASSGKNVEAKNNKSQKRMPRTMPRIKPEDGDGGLKKIKEIFKNRPQNKMGGGMMKKPMMANKGKMADKKADKKIPKFIQRRMKLSGRLSIPLLVGAGLGKAAKKFFKNKNVGVFPYVKPKKKMGGGMMQRPMMAMGYDTGDLASAETQYKKVKPSSRKKAQRERLEKIKKRKKDPRDPRGPGPLGSIPGGLGGRGISNVPRRLERQPVIPTPKLAVPQMSKGSSVKVKVKLGRNKPTKLF